MTRIADEYPYVYIVTVSLLRPEYLAPEYNIFEGVFRTFPEAVQRVNEIAGHALIFDIEVLRKPLSHMGLEAKWFFMASGILDGFSGVLIFDDEYGV